MKPAETKLLTTVLIFCMLVGAGCTKLSTEYGRTSGSSAYSSINGYGTFRLALENAGFTDRDIGRLTDRLKKSTDLVVWAPQNGKPLNAEAVAWMDSWLKQANRTLVYINPDSGSETEYWTSTIPLAPAEKRLEYRRLAAKSRNQRMQNRFNTNQAPSYQWFTITRLARPETIRGVKGPWKPKGNTTIQAPLTPLEHGVVTSMNPARVTIPATVATPNLKSGTGSPAVQTSSIQYTRRPLLETKDGTAYVAEVTSKKWNDSRIIVVSSGSLLSNFGLTQRPNQLLADRIIQEVAAAKNSGLRAGFLNNDGTSLTVSSKDNGVPVASGMEILTVWPISLLTMHGIFLGLVICLMLLPIFGRPKKISHNQSGNFGDHLDAVAALMKRAGGEKYARSKISDYMKRMRGETTGPWIIKEALPTPPKPIHTLQPNRLSKNTASQVPAEATQQTNPQTNATESAGSLTPSEGTNATAESQPDGKKIE